MASTKSSRKHKKSQRVAPAPLIQAEIVPAWFPATIKWLVFGFLFLLPWLKFTTVTIITATQYFALIWLATVLTGLLVYGLIRNWISVPRSRFFWLAGTWVGVVVLSSIFSSNRYLSLWGSYQVWTDGLLFLLTTLLVVSAFFNIKPTRDDIRLLINGLLAQGFILAVVTVAEAVGKGFPAKAIRAFGPLYNSDYLISYGFLLLPIFAVFFVAAWRGRQSMWLRASYGAGLLTLLCALFVSMPYGVQDVVYRLPNILHITSSSTSHEEVAKPVSEVSQFLGNASNDERFTQWELGLQIGRENLLLGNGLGTTREAFFAIEAKQDIPGWAYERGAVMDHPHNDVIEQFATTGLLGAGFYLVMWVGFFWLLFANRRRIEPEDRPLVWALAAGLFLFFAFNQAIFTSFVPGVLFPIWMAIILILSGQVEYVKVTAYKAVYLAASCLLLCGLFYASYQAWNYLEGEYHYAQALTSQNDENPLNSTLVAAVEAQNAVEAYPREGAYQWLAADSNLMLYFNPPEEINLTDKEGLEKQIRGYAEEAVRLSPVQPVYNLTRALTHYLFSAKGSAEEKEAGNEIEKAISLDPKFFRLYVKAGNAYAVKGDFATGQAYYKRALEFAPDSDLETLNDSIEEMAKLQAAQ